MGSKKYISAILVSFLIIASFQPNVYASGIDLGQKDYDTYIISATSTDCDLILDKDISDNIEELYDSEPDVESSESILKFYANTDIDYAMDDIVSSTPLEEVIIPDNQYVNDGYTFVGWNTEPDGSGDSYDAGDPFVIPEDLSSVAFYAQWMPIKYTIYFDGNSASSGVMSSIKCVYGESYILPNITFKKNGYSFAGWNTKKDGSGIGFSNLSEVCDLSTVDADTVILYAQWMLADYSVTYDKGHTNTDNPTTYNMNSETIILQDPTWKGHTFVGWFSDSDHTKKVSSIKKGSTGDKTFYAKWTTNKYTVKYNGNGSTSGTMKDTTCKYGATYYFTKNAFKRTGYTFAGWNSRKDGTGTAYKNGQEFKNLRSNDGAVANLHAQWKVNQYTVIFDPNGGTGTMESKVYKYDSAYNLPANKFTKTGYVFAGWTTKAAGTGTLYKNKSSVSNLRAGNNATITFYAQWKLKKAIIKDIVKESSSKNIIKITSQNCDGYDVYRSTSKSGAFKLLKSITSTKYTDSTVKAGTTYYYKVRAYNYNGTGKKVYGPFSDIYSVKYTTVGNEEALKEAKRLLSFIPYSYTELKNELIDCGFTTSQAKYGADNCGGDWNKNALKQAKNILSCAPYSHAELKNELKDHGFTTSQAKYGADNCGANWKKNALKCAENLLEFIPYSYSDLINELKDYGFTSEQAQYGADNIEADWNQNALDRADICLEYNYYSYVGLIKELQDYGFTSEQAQYGADNCGANWKKNALQRAKEYLEYDPYSYSGLIKELEDDGFTSEQAQYGADNCGANWKKNALQRAKEYLEYDSYSYSGLREELEDDGFTSTQAQYGVDNCGADWKQQAVKSAKKYRSWGGYTNAEIIQELLDDGFTQAQAEYGARNSW